MKFGIHLSTMVHAWSDDHFAPMERLKEMGYDGVEFPLMDPDNFDLTRAKNELKRLNLLATCGTGLLPHADITSNDPAVHKAGVDRLLSCLQIAHQLESDLLGGVLYAPWGLTRPRMEMIEGKKRSQQTLRQLAVKAKAYGVKMGLEMINRYETSYLNHTEDAAEWMAAIKDPMIGIHYDTFHANMEETNQKEAILSLGQHLFHVHFCENNRGIPGTGQVDFSSVAEGLKEIGYDRWLTLENFALADCQIGNDCAIWKSKTQDPYQAAEQGLQYAKKIWEETK